MIDIDLFRSILQHDDDGFIDYGDFISHELLFLFATSKVKKVKSLFKKSQNCYSQNTYDVELSCESCGEHFIEKVTKTKLFNIIQYIKGSKKSRLPHIFCQQCEKEYQEISEKEQEKQDEFLQEQMTIQTNRYIELYLNPSGHWEQGTKTWQKIEALKSGFVDRNKIATFIKSMEYHDFLKTPYWKAIAEKVKRKAKNRCQICNGTENLNVHHRSYANHGEELYHLEDLMCICKKCHQKHHFE